MDQPQLDARWSTFNSAGGNIITVNNIIPSHSQRHERRTIAQWLSPLNFKGSQSAFLQRREKDTGIWFLESQTFTDWRDNGPGSIWCPGNPGAGKTILASIVVDHLRRSFTSHDIAVACIYCNYKEQTVQTVPNIIASILKQLVQDRDTISENVEFFYNHHQDLGTQPTLDEIVKALETELQTYYRVFLVVDALDECPDNGNRAKLLRVLRSLPGHVSLMVTSRQLPSIEQYFRNTMRLEIRANDADVRKYVENLLLDYPELEQLQEIIIRKVVENARGMFLLASLHMDKLVQQNSDKEVLQALDNLPEGIDGIYDDAMDRIERQSEADRQLAKKVLSWITHACRPLSVDELQDALAVSPNMTKMDPRALIYERKLTSVCAGLVVIDGQRIIRLAHYTTQQYFENRRESLLSGAQTCIATTCLTYLAFDVFQCGYCRDDQEFESLLKNHPLLDYAARNWGHHAHEQDEIVARLALHLLQNDQHLACTSQILLVDSQYGYDGYSQVFPRDCSGLHIAAFFGVEHIVRFLLENGVQPDSKNSHCQTALSIAAGHGHDAVIDLLLAADNVDVNPQDTNGLTPLLLATKNSRDAVVKKLLSRKDVDPNVTDDVGWTPLAFAASNGNEALTHALLSRHDIQVNSRDSWNRTPLTLAASNGHAAVVNAFLARSDIEADSLDVDGSTPFLLASSNGHEEVIKLLLSRGEVQANRKGKWDRTALSSAAFDGHHAVVKLLLACENVDVNSKDGDGRTPLSFSASNGHLLVVRELLGVDGIEIDSKDRFGRTPLSFAAAGGHAEVAKLLLAHRNIDPNSTSRDGQTPLSFAAKNGHGTTVKLLLTCEDIEADAKDNSGHTPLWYAAKNGHDGVVRLLIAHKDVKLDSAGWLARTPLSVAASGGHSAVVALLLACHIDANSRDSTGHTPLSLAASNGHEAVVKALLSYTHVDINSENDHGRTPLSLAASNGREGVVRLLLGRNDLDLNVQDHLGRCTLAFAAANGREAVVQLLLAHHHVDVNLADHGGHPPSWFAAKNKHQAIIELFEAHRTRLAASLASGPK